jgi:hypothetical protein
MTRQRLNPEVGRVLATYPAAARARVLELRATILEVAAGIDGVGPLEEGLRWGEPAYLTSASGSGTTIRIAWKARFPECSSLFVNCRTSLIETFTSLFPELDCHDNREVRLTLSDPLPDCIPDCIALALTYRKPRLLGPRSGMADRLSSESASTR